HSALNCADVKSPHQTDPGRHPRKAVRSGGAGVRGTRHRRRQYRGNCGGSGFYSNFDSKDELIIAMMEDHVAQSIARMRDLLARHRNLADFIEALKSMDR